MNLNSVSMFGDKLDWNSNVALALMIIATIILAFLVLALILKLVKLLKKKPAQEAAAEEKVVVVQQQPAEPQVIVVQQQPVEPQVIYVQQPAAPAPVVQVQQAPAPTPEPVQVIQTPAPYANQPLPTIMLPEDEEDDFGDEEDIIEEETFEGGKVTYNRSFMAKYIQSSDETKDFYVHLKNKILSYKKVRGRLSWKRESFTFGRYTMARLVFRGKTLCLCLPLDPANFTESKYHVEDVSNISLYADTPCMYRIRNERRLNYAYDLLEMVGQHIGTIETARHYEDYYLPYEGLVQLIDKGLVKRVIRYNTKDFVAGQQQPTQEPLSGKQSKKDKKHKK